MTPPAWQRALAVGVGGATGTGLRAAIVASMPRTAGLPIGVLVANVAGALALAVLVTVTPPERSLLRAGLGTGVLGAFTTFSALTVDTAVLARDGHPGAGAAYVAVTLVAGIGAALVGRAVGRRLRRAGGRG